MNARLDESRHDGAALRINDAGVRRGLRCVRRRACVLNESVLNDKSGTGNGRFAGAIDELAVVHDRGAWLELHGACRLPFPPPRG